MARVLVYGGTGSQARPTVDHLLSKGHTPVVVTRRDNIEGCEFVQADMADADAILKITKDIDAVAFLLPAFLNECDDAAQFGKTVINAAVVSGVSRFVWNASGPIPNDDNDAKKQILDYLMLSPLNWLVFEPTTYMENWLGPWTAPFVMNDDEVSYPVLDHVKMGWLACDDVGKLVVAAIESEHVRNVRFDISGLESPTGPELAVKFSRALNRGINYRAMAPGEMGSIIDQAFGAGVGNRIAAMYKAEQEDPNPEPKFHDMSYVLKALPVDMYRIEDWVKANAKQFTK